MIDYQNLVYEPSEPGVMNGPGYYRTTIVICGSSKRWVLETVIAMSSRARKNSKDRQDGTGEHFRPFWVGPGS